MIRLLIVLLVVVFSFPVFGQVDTATQKKVQVEGFLNFGGAFQTGNVNMFALSSSFSLKIKSKKISSVTFANYSFTEISKKNIQNDLFAYEIFGFFIKNRLYPKVSAMVELSNSKSINNRYIFGAGFGYRVLESDLYNFSIINSLVYESSRFNKNSSKNYSGFRYSLILNGNYILLENRLILTHNIFIHPFMINSKNNYRFRVLLSALMPLSKKLSIQIKFDYNNESIVDDFYKTVNTNTTFGISYKL